MSVESVPISEIDLGIDERVAREMRSLILDRTVELAPSGRTVSQEYYGVLNWDGLMEYAGWLCRLLELDPEDPNSRPLSTEDIDRASRLNIGPSSYPFVNKKKHGIAEMQAELGFNSPARYRGTTLAQLQKDGIRLAKKVGGRPTGDDIYEAWQQGEIASLPFIRSRGGIANFQELIGYPHPRGWQEDDYLDWGVAFKRQNGPDKRITFGVMNELSLRGCAPSVAGIYRDSPFKSIPEFEERAMKRYQEVIDAELDSRYRQFEAINELYEHDEAFPPAAKGHSGDKLLKIAAQYRLVKACISNLPPGELKEVAHYSSPDSVAQYIMKHGAEITMGRIELTAVVLGVFDTLWPMYRFQNADLRVAA